MRRLYLLSFLFFCCTANAGTLNINYYKGPTSAFGVPRPMNSAPYSRPHRQSSPSSHLSYGAPSGPQIYQTIRPQHLNIRPIPFHQQQEQGQQQIRFQTSSSSYPTIPIRFQNTGQSFNGFVPFNPSSSSSSPYKINSYSSPSPYSQHQQQQSFRGSQPTYSIPIAISAIKTQIQSQPPPPQAQPQQNLRTFPLPPTKQYQPRDPQPKPDHINFIIPLEQVPKAQPVVQVANQNQYASPNPNPLIFNNNNNGYNGPIAEESPSDSNNNNNNEGYSAVDAESVGNNENKFEQLGENLRIRTTGKTHDLSDTEIQGIVNNFRTYLQSKQTQLRQHQQQQQQQQPQTQLRQQQQQQTQIYSDPAHNIAAQNPQNFNPGYIENYNQNIRSQQQQNQQYRPVLNSQQIYNQQPQQSYAASPIRIPIRISPIPTIINNNNFKQQYQPRPSPLTGHSGRVYGQPQQHQQQQSSLGFNNFPVRNFEIYQEYTPQRPNNPSGFYGAPEIETEQQQGSEGLQPVNDGYVPVKPEKPSGLYSLPVESEQQQGSEGLEPSTTESSTTQSPPELGYLPPKPEQEVQQGSGEFNPPSVPSGFYEKPKEEQITEQGPESISTTEWYEAPYEPQKPNRPSGLYETPPNEQEEQKGSEQLSPEADYKPQRPSRPSGLYNTPKDEQEEQKGSEQLTTTEASYRPQKPSKPSLLYQKPNEKKEAEVEAQGYNLAYGQRVRPTTRAQKMTMSFSTSSSAGRKEQQQKNTQFRQSIPSNKQLDDNEALSFIINRGIPFSKGNLVSYTYVEDEDVQNDVKPETGYLPPKSS